MLRTRRLSAGTITQAKPVELPVYTCPADVRAILRDVRIGNPHTTTAKMVLTAVLSGGLGSVRVWTATVPGETVAGTACDVVFEPGDTLFLFSDLTMADYYLSGAELTLSGEGALA